ncbi:MAG TPA: TIGR02265 family protein [Gemmatimonadales bacterium]|nr:TIGR02265 family protein [Gemmatimonadales bacterium]
MQQIKGAVLKSRLGFVEEHAGKDGLVRVLEALPPDDQRSLKLVFTSNWYPFELGKRLDDAIVRVLNGGRTEFFEKLGEASAARNLGSLHSGYVTAGDPHAFLAKAPAIYSMYYEAGRREYHKTGENSATLTTWDAETFSAPDCLTVIGWYRKALEMCGAEGVRVVEEECRAKGGASCRYAISWK